MAWRDERDIGRGEREVPEQLLAADIRKLLQTYQLLVREYLHHHETDLQNTSNFSAC